jgi:hypothetical protein
VIGIGAVTDVVTQPTRVERGKITVIFSMSGLIAAV